VFVLVYLILGVVDLGPDGPLRPPRVRPAPAAAEEETPVLHFTY
jgi:hypothetical protein